MLDFIVAKALGKDLDERYPNAQQLADDLRECRAQIKAAPARSPAVVAAVIVSL